MARTEPNRNTLWARTLATELGRHGLEHVCVGSGSRSAPLVDAFVRDAAFRVHPHIDERAAAFFALGVGAATGRPAAVVTTSGTAAANLFPAVIEASQGEIPVLVITADRPAALRGLDANQTIDQVRLFGTYPRCTLDLPLPWPGETALGFLRAVAARLWAAASEAPRGPVHLNVQLEKPLEPTLVPGDVLPGVSAAGDGGPGSPPSTAVIAGTRRSDQAERALLEALGNARRPVIVCGPTHASGSGPPALKLAARITAPVLADPLSGARFHPDAPSAAVGWADAILRADDARRVLAPDLVVRIGPAPTSACVNQYLEDHHGAEQVVLDPGGRWKDHLGTASRYLRVDAAVALTRVTEKTGAVAEDGWLARWRELEEAAGEALAGHLADEWFEGAVANATFRSLPQDATFFIGNSMPIRDVDAFVPPSARALHVVGFRGASGIDGNVSGAIGAATARGRPAAALIGDLTLLHDVGALLGGRTLEAPLQIVVVQNRGGGIFHLLPIRDFDPPFTRHIVMPHDVDFAAVAAAGGITHRRTATRSDLEQALEEGWSGPGIGLIEVITDREDNRRRREAALSAAGEAVTRRL
jgi:2-succinyl-5-enolpyruvyl-6-hydroxy-3-cyclohexene-1-carboxylate synthase